MPHYLCWDLACDPAQPPANRALCSDPLHFPASELPSNPPKEGFSSPTPAPCALVPSESGYRVIIYCLPQATPSDFFFDLQTALPK